MYQKSISPKLLEVIEKTYSQIRANKLDPYTTLFEMVDYKQLNEIAAFGGFPTRYPHWRWGMEFDRISKSHAHGLSKIYEMVINNDPCYAYLLDSNSISTHKTVIAHVYAHSDFFKNNLWFNNTPKKMLNQIANNAAYIKKIIDDFGYQEVESFIDTCLSLEDLIDVNRYEYSQPNINFLNEENNFTKKALNNKAYLDNYIITNSKNSNLIATNIATLNEPIDDVLEFLTHHAPLKDWQRNVLSIIRQESYYFLPQKQTKILNEGWATYWHSEMMTKIMPLDASEIIEYCDQYSSIIQNNHQQINPYRLGLQLLRYIKRKWDKGQHGSKYSSCDDYIKKKRWDNKDNKGKEKIFEVRKIYNDITFLDAFIDDDFCVEHDIYITDKNTKVYQASKVKKSLLDSLTNIGNPIIRVNNINHNSKGELFLVHDYRGKNLRKDYAIETIKNIYKIWTKPVYLQTKVNEYDKTWGFDGKNVIS